MSARSDAALSITGGILGGITVGTWIARRYLTTQATKPASPYSQADAATEVQRRLREAKS